MDYDRAAPTTGQFFATVQNKLHFAVHGHTSAELIAERADSQRPNMGLTSWENAAEGKILRTDITIGKNSSLARPRRPRHPDRHRKNLEAAR